METLILVLVAGGALALVVLPLLRTRRPAPRAGVEDVDTSVARYREAIRAGTMCERCPEPNPPGSRFCARCGARLPEAV